MTKDNLPAVISEKKIIQAVLHPQGGDNVVATFPDYPRLCVAGTFDTLNKSILDGLNQLYTERNEAVPQAIIHWQIAAPADTAPDLSFMRETCLTCVYFLRTPGSSALRKDVCRYWVPTATAQNQYAYLTHVEDATPACGCYFRNPGSVLRWDYETNKYVEEQSCCG